MALAQDLLDLQLYVVIIIFTVTVVSQPKSQFDLSWDRILSSNSIG